jgi:hypothetical protein
VWGGRSRHSYTFTRQPDGTTDMDIVIVREGKNVKGRLLAAFLETFGNWAVMARFDDTVAAVEARYERVPAAEVC